VVAYTAHGVGRELERVAADREHAGREADRLAAIVQSCSDAIYAKSLDGTIVAWNASAERLFGYGQDEVVGRSARLLVPPGAEDELAEMLEQIAAGERIEHKETNRVRKDGSSVRVSLSESPLHDAQGCIVGVSVIVRDLSGQRRAEAALKQSEADFRLLTDAMPQIVWIARPDGWNVYLNQYWMDYTGRTLEESAGFEWNKAFHPDDQERAWQAWRQAVATIGIYSLECRLRRADGVYRWWLIRGLPMRDAAGHVVKWCGTCTDIHDLKLAKVEASESEQRFAQVFHSTLIAVGIADTSSGRLIDVNTRCTEFFGYTRHEMIGHTALELGLWADPGQRERFIAPMSNGGSSAGGEAAFRHKSGEIRHALVSLERMTAAGITAPLHMVVLVDITQRKRVADELRESERRFSSVLDNVNLVSLMLDREARITYCNDYLLELTDRTREEVLGRSWFDLFLSPEQGDLRDVHNALLANRPEAWHHENEILTRAGGRRLIRWNNSVLRSPAGDVIGTASIGEDVTQQKDVEDQLRQAQKMEAIGRLAGGIAHDFNNELGVIVGYTELVIRHADEAQRGKLGEVMKAAQRATGLTRQLLTFSRKYTVDPKILSLNTLLLDLEKMLGRLIGEDIDLAIIPGVDLGRVKVDAGQFEQVVMNLCLNARDAMPDGGLLRIQTANVDLDESHGALHGARHQPMTPGPYVMLSVTDAGCGMSNDVLTKIFEPFYTTKGTGKGTGLGLAMVYGVVKQAAGFIWAYSEVGRGSTFRIYLPRIDEAVAAAAPETPMPRRGSETILLVEDEESLRAITHEILAEHGYRVLEATGPTHALEVAARHPEAVHLLFTDVVMPGMNGRVLAESLLKVRPDLRVLYMTGYTDDALEHSGVLETGALVLEKPFTALALLERVRAALENKDEREDA